QVDVERQCVESLALDAKPGIANQQRDAQTFLISGALVAKAVLAKIVAIVAGEDDDSVVGQFQLIEGLQDATEIVVSGGDAAEIVEIGGHLVARLGGSTGWSCRVAVDGRDTEIRHSPSFLTGIIALASRRRIKGAVRRLETDDQQERLLLVLAQELQGVIGADIIDPALRLGQLAIDLDRTIHVAPLADEAGGIIKA